MSSFRSFLKERNFAPVNMGATLNQTIQEFLEEEPLLPISKESLDEAAIA